MKIRDMRLVYPAAAAVLQRLIDEGNGLLAPAETLSEAAIARIDSGLTPLADVKALLEARAAQRRRAS